MQKSKKFLVLILIFSLIFAAIPAYADVSTTSVTEDIITDGSISSAKWFSMFDSLLTTPAEKVLNGAKFYLVLASLKDPVLASQVTAAFNSNATRKTLLESYGLSDGKVHDIMMFYLNTYPASMAQVEADRLNYGNNIYSDIYHDETLVYSTYMLRFYEYLNEQFSNLTPAMKDPISIWDVAGQGEIHVYQDILNIIIKDYIFHQVTNYDTGVVTKDMYLRPFIKDVVVNEITRVGTAGGTAVDAAQINEYADMFYALGNVILESAEANLKATGQLDNAMDLGDKVLLVLRSSIGPTEIPPTVLINPDLATIYYNPTPDTIETDNIQYKAFVQNSTAGVIWSIDDPDVGTIDQNGVVTISPTFVPDIDNRQTATIRATLVGNPGVFDTATVEIITNTAAGPLSFYGPYISGYTDGTFKLERFVTRAEAATMFTRVLSLDNKKLDDVLIYPSNKFVVPSYSDITKTHWAYLYIEIAKAEGLLGGYDDGTFRPNAPMSRAEIAVLISNAWTALGVEKDIAAKHEITDVKKDHWAFDAINSVYNALIVDGFEDKSFRPTENTKREHIVTMINKLIDRPKYNLPTNKFSDVKFGYWAFGDVIAATMFQAAGQLFETDPNVTPEQ